MSAISPFRSHLLQQWARQAHGRAPAAVAPWLKSSNNMGAHQGTTEDPAVSLHHSEELSSRGYSNIAPSISMLDSDSYSTTLGPRRVSPEQVDARTFVTVTTPDARADSKVKGEERAMSPSRDHHGALLAADEKVEQSDNYQRIYHDEDDESSMAFKFQSILMDRRTSTNLTVSSSSQNELCQALDRAVACAQMAPNHKRTEPFSFLRFMAGSEAAKKLARIAYEVSLREKGSVPNAESKQRKWLRISGFLVALVHENQGEAKINHASSDQDEYDLLPYLAPETERQLEDVRVQHPRSYFRFCP